MSADLDRFKTRLNESNAMKEEKSDWKKEIEEYHNAMMRNERNNGREDVYEAIDAVFDNRLYFDAKNDFKQQLKLYIQNKGK